MDIFLKLLAGLYWVSINLSTFFSSTLGLIVFFLIFSMIFFKESLYALYIIQLKEYRRYKLKEYFASKEWSKVLFPKRNLYRLISFITLIVGLLLIMLPVRTEFEWLGILSIFWITLLFFSDSLNAIKSLIKRGAQWLKLTTRAKTIFVVHMLVSLVFWLPFCRYYVASDSLEPVAIFLLYSMTYLIVIFGIMLVSLAITAPLAESRKKRLYLLAAKKRKALVNLTTLWIAWSYGKSSVKFFLRELLQKSFKIAVPSGNINSEVWLANYVNKSLNKSHELFITEMWAYRVGENALIGQIIQQQDWFLTWLNNQHVWLFWSLKNAIQAESEVREQVENSNWVMYVNANDELINSSFVTSAQIVLYGMIKDKSKHATYSDWDAVSFIEKNTPWEIVFTFTYKKHKHRFSTNVVGLHNIINLTWAIAYCVDKWLTLIQLDEIIKHIGTKQKTLKMKKVDWRIVLDDTYNINQNWVIAACQVLETYKTKKKFIAIDEIIELWEDAEKTHELLWNAVWQFTLDGIFLSGKYYTSSFKKWLKNAWFDDSLIYTDLEEFKHQTQGAVIAFLWRRSKSVLTMLSK